jgi:hypothetical protein
VCGECGCGEGEEGVREWGGGGEVGPYKITVDVFIMEYHLYLNSYKKLK